MREIKKKLIRKKSDLLIVIGSQINLLFAFAFVWSWIDGTLFHLYIGGGREWLAHSVGHPQRFLSSMNRHWFVLKIGALQPISNAKHIWDRQVVVVRWLEHFLRAKVFCWTSFYNLLLFGCSRNLSHTIFLCVLLSYTYQFIVGLRRSF